MAHLTCHGSGGHKHIVVWGTDYGSSSGELVDREGQGGSLPDIRFAGWWEGLGPWGQLLPRQPHFCPGLQDTHVPDKGTIRASGSLSWESVLLQYHYFISLITDI